MRQDRVHVRLLIIAGVASLWMGAVFGRLTYLQLFRHSEYLSRALRQQQRTFEITPERGAIYDRNGRPLAMSIPVDSAFAVPSEIADENLAARLLSGVINKPQEEIEARLESSRSFAWIARKLPPEKADAISKLNLKGIYLQKENQRFYPKRDLAAHVLGFVDVDEKGLSGIERELDNQIRGDQGECVGVRASVSGQAVEILADATVLATGGCGQVYRYTTNPQVATGDGYAIAYRAGVRLADMEFVQFHPTALDTPENPLALISEAVRGEGAVLVTAAGIRFMPERHRLAELAPRDIVAREIFREQREGHAVYLDARRLEASFEQRFPGIFALCRARGIDPRTDLIPVTPAAHYTRWAGWSPISWGGRVSPGSSPAARCHAPACTERTDWPRTLCSRAWCSRSEWLGICHRCRRCRPHYPRWARGASRRCPTAGQELQQIEGFATANLSENDAVRAVAEGCLQQVSDSDSGKAVLFAASLESNEVFLREVNLGSVLDHEHPLVLGNEFSEDR